MNYRCTTCGRFVGYEEFFDGKATIVMITPDSEFTKETWDITCTRCNEKNHENAKTNIQ